MRNRFDLQLKQLNDDIIEMGNMIERAIEMGVYALIGHDTDKAKQTIDYDMDIDHMERDIEALCMKLLLQQQPVARDLRVISSALKMIGDMERIGDQAADIAEIVKYLKEDDVPNLRHLREMSDFAAGMVTASINSFVRQDLDLARKVILDDDVVDGYFEKVKEALIGLIADGDIDGAFLLDILMIAKYIERVGDHATNIAEWVVYSITGQHPEESN